ncbi:MULTISPECIES: ATP-binding protein [unclassified Streptomyces]|uniref:ATP-binding protein n=1 Tax=unclassified Streptomyces TaxID=2593676 RepID=UPI0033AAE658
MSTLVSNLRLAATPTAASCARIFVAHALREWQADALVQDAQLVVSELVTNAVQATGVPKESPTWLELEGLQLLHVGVYGHGRSVTIQVWDSSKEPPVKQKAGGEAWAESGRGLAIVEALALHVGHFFLSTGGKVVWAELALPGVVQPLPRRMPKDLSNVVLPQSDPDTLLKLLDGLQKL